ncbi:FtsH protease activity modulator HflK [Buchnera aphidicola (Muscaphis stroyani)]|uniref:Protein HflK n=1 Tax=Buchnera aphidicola (Muscaphis stroyani) TaxID=1241869 RepID=A0A4D6Y602_9GAMM|nr:FtsH protease activity modulator HflK [Buchnera aphidicola]QCI24599.1 FtsH protease activity modulator HflK [Buchnera aphidicola (Muscaphis stroyani)]
MAWKKPKDHASKLDPWGKKKDEEKKIKDQDQNDKKNPILDAKNFLYNIKNVIFIKSCSSNLFKKKFHPFTILIFTSAIIWFFSGFYTLEEAERGVITRFGEFVYVAKPGLNWRPIFIDEVKIINVKTTRELAASGIMLTSDQNVIRVETNIQYKIVHPVDYLFSASYPDKSLKQAADSSLSDVIGSLTMDKILNGRGILVGRSIQKKIKKTIKPYNMGIAILDVNFKTVKPPEAIKKAFDDVISARENREQYIQEAEAYSNEIQPKAKEKAEIILKKARAYSSRIILEAEGEAARFSKILPEYRKSKAMTLKHFYIESMERLLSHTKKIFTDSKNNSMFFLSLDKIFSNSALVNNSLLNNVHIKKNHTLSLKKNKEIDYFSSLSPKNILEQRYIDSLRNDVKNSERK